MSLLARASRCLSSQFNQRLSLTNPLLKLSLFNSSTTNNEQPSQPGPPPIRVGFTDSAGRGVFATRRISSAELIHTAKPVVTHPSLSKNGTVCYLCLRRLKPTNHSHHQPFCSLECRQQAQAFYELEKQADWAVYHEYCRNQGLKYPLLVKRLACMVVAGAASPDCINILQPAQILPEIKMEYNMLRSAFEEMDFTSESLKFLSQQWYADVLARIRINAFRVEIVAGSYEDLLTQATALVETEAGVGNAVYILPSFYNHDCDPNVNIIWMDNVHARLKALRDVEEGEELRICYIDASMDYDARQKILLQGFGFKCSCYRCLSGD